MRRRPILRNNGKHAVHGANRAPDAYRPIPGDFVRALLEVLIIRVNRVILLLLQLYRRTLSPLLGQRCRFDPSCSDYASIAVARFGSVRGGLLAVWRLARCQPLSRGGFDPVPQVFTLRPAKHDHDAPHTHHSGEEPHE